MTLSALIKKKIKNAFFPVRCPYCDIVMDPELYACNDCKPKLPEIEIVSYIEGGYRCTAPFLYKDCFAQAVKMFKFSKRVQYADQLAFAVVSALVGSGINLGFDYITCVPMHREQFMDRGYNQSEVLAKRCAELMGIEYIDALEKFKKNKIQHNLKGSERRSNVKGVYRAVNIEKIRDKRILLIDDVVTTGSTLAECAKILNKCGCKEIQCAAVCARN